MARWGLIISAVLIVIALFLASGFFTYYAGHEHWITSRAGFLAGMIHGIIAPIMLVAQIFTRYTMYELNNSGWFYNFGFLAGLLAVWGGGSKAEQHIIKNYYSAPAEKEAKPKLSEEETKTIGKIIEEKIAKVVGRSENKPKPQIAKKSLKK